MSHAQESHDPELALGTVSRPEFGNRRTLLADLERAFDLREPKLLVVIELVGLKKVAEEDGAEAANEIVRRLARKLTLVVGAAGTCYRLRRSELGALIDGPISDKSVVIDALSSTLGESGSGYTIEPSFGTTLTPEEAPTPLETLELADKRLTAQRRAREATPRPSRTI